MRIEVYKCPFTGNIFEKKDKDKYIKHLEKLRANMKEDREYKKIKDKFDGWLAAEKEKITHIDMIVPWIIENQRYLMKAYNAVDPSSNWDGKFHPATDKFTKLKLTANYDPSVSNTHTCPHNGVTNWGGRVVGAPRGYPGWHGHIEGSFFRKKDKHRYPISALFKLLRLNTGTGGGGNEEWGYSVEIFLADWPGLAQQLTFEKLRGTK